MWSVIESMMKGLRRYREPAILMALGIFMFIWGVEKLNEMAGPGAFVKVVEERIDRAEMRSKAYVDEKTSHTEKLMADKHAAVMGAINRLDRSVEGFHKEIRDVYRDGRTANRAGISGANNKERTWTKIN